MREDKKLARQQNKLAALLGLDVPPATAPPPKVQRTTASRDAEAVIDFVAAPNTYARVTCRVCGHDFLVNRANVSCCSDACRAAELERVGIKWDWNKPPESRWYVTSQTGNLTNEPLVVPPAALTSLMNALSVWKKDTNVVDLVDSE